MKGLYRTSDPVSSVGLGRRGTGSPASTLIELVVVIVPDERLFQALPKKWDSANESRH
jgi:hypothetical protein